MSDVKIKNITVVVDGQEYSFTSKSLVPIVAYNPVTDPEVQGTSLADLSAAPIEAETPTPEATSEPIPTDISVADSVEPLPAPTE